MADYLENNRKKTRNLAYPNRNARRSFRLTLHSNFLNYADLMKGAVIDIKMGPTPNKKRGINKEDFPYSFSNEVK